MTSKAWLVRHGPTHAKSLVGWTDLAADLSDHAALARLADALPPAAPVISSDLSRARDTATAIIGNRPRLADRADLRELNFGDWDGLTFEEADALHPGRLREFYETPGEISAPGGESWNAFCARVNAAVDDLLARHGEVVIVCHMGAILAQVQRASGLSAYDTFARTIDNLSLTELLSAPEGPRLGRVNHLP